MDQFEKETGISPVEVGRAADWLIEHDQSEMGLNIKTLASYYETMYYANEDLKTSLKTMVEREARLQREIEDILETVRQVAPWVEANEGGSGPTDLIIERFRAIISEDGT